VKTLSTLSPQEWEEIRERFGVSKVMLWRAPTREERQKHRGKPVGLRLLGDGTYEVQINLDAVRCRPRSVPREQYTLYALYYCLGHIELGHLDPVRQQELLRSHVRRGVVRPGLVSLRMELDRAAKQWALARLNDPPNEERPNTMSTVKHANAS
jgi:hypothetical protein